MDKDEDIVGLPGVAGGSFATGENPHRQRVASKKNENQTVETTDSITTTSGADETQNWFDRASFGRKKNEERKIIRKKENENRKAIKENENRRTIKENENRRTIKENENRRTIKENENRRTIKENENRKDY